MKALCGNCRVKAYCVVKLLAIKVEELDVCGSLVLSNLVTYTTGFACLWRVRKSLFYVCKEYMSYNMDIYLQCSKTMLMVVIS